MGKSNTYELARQLGVGGVHAEEVFWPVCGTDVVQCSKYTYDNWDRFREWCRQNFTTPPCVWRPNQPLYPTRGGITIPVRRSPFHRRGRVN
jgi:hypothetical protein